MRYMLLIYDDAATWATATQEQVEDMLQEYGKLTGELIERGLFVHGEGLQPTTTATTVRVREGDTLVTDGPFAETKEYLGGFFLIDAKDLDEAIEVASKIPAVKYASVEIRPVIERHA